MDLAGNVPIFDPDLAAFTQLRIGVYVILPLLLIGGFHIISFTLRCYHSAFRFIRLLLFILGTYCSSSFSRTLFRGRPLCQDDIASLHSRSVCWHSPWTVLWRFESLLTSAFYQKFYPMLASVQQNGKDGGIDEFYPHWQDFSTTGRNSSHTEMVLVALISTSKNTPVRDFSSLRCEKRSYANLFDQSWFFFPPPLEADSDFHSHETVVGVNWYPWFPRYARNQSSFFICFWGWNHFWLHYGKLFDWPTIRIHYVEHRRLYKINVSVYSFIAHVKAGASNILLWASQWNHWRQLSIFTCYIALSNLLWKL